MANFSDNYIGYLLARCSYEVSAQFHHKLKSEGVHVITWRVLASIRRQARTVNDLAERVLVNQSTLSKALDRMERDDLIERQPVPEFRSKVEISITEKGQELIDRLIDLANDYENLSLRQMSNDDMRQLKKLLHRLIDD